MKTKSKIVVGLGKEMKKNKKKSWGTSLNEKFSVSVEIKIDEVSTRCDPCGHLFDNIDSSIPYIDTGITCYVNRTHLGCIAELLTEAAELRRLREAEVQPAVDWSIPQFLSFSIK